MRLDNVYSGDVSASALAAMGVAIAARLRAGERLRCAEAEERDARNRAGGSAASDCRSPMWRRRGRCVPGEDLELIVALAGENGVAISKTASVSRAGGRAAGYAVLHRVRRDVHQHARFASGQWRRRCIRPRRCSKFLNGLRSNTKAYVRVWRAETVVHRGGPRSSGSAAVARDDPCRGQPAAAMLLNTARRRKSRRSKFPPGDTVVIGIEDGAGRGEGVKWLRVR